LANRRDIQLRSLKYVLLPDSSPNPNNSASYTANRSHRQRRTQFLFVYSYLIQVVLMAFLTVQDSTDVGRVVGSGKL
jgi:hypothetical protein